MSTIKTKIVSAPINGPTVEPLVLQTNNTDRVTVNSSGNVGIGTSSPADGLLHLNGGTSTNIKFTNATTGTSGSDGFFVGLAASNDNIGYVFQRENAALILGTNNAERARIDASGNLLVGTTSAGGFGLSIYPPLAGNANTSYLAFNRTATTSAGTALLFQNNGTTVGSITHTNTGTTYSTTSDYRLKENVQPITGALAKVSALKPCTYTWKADGSAGEGFIAHELQAIVPDAVTGEKDAVNEDGSIKPQGIDPSFLVATLTAAIQEQQAMIEELKAKVAALETNE